LSSSEEHNVKYRDVVKGEMASFDISTQARKTKEETKSMKENIWVLLSSTVLNFTY